MTRPIGYYVHHQGAGHLHRARLIKAALRRPCTLMGTFESESDVLDLSDDRSDPVGFSGRDGAADRPHAFHYAPLGVRGLRSRMADIAAWIDAYDPVLFVVDVSVEVVLFVRLMSVPVVVMRLAGRREDPPHLEAFRAAERLLAPFPAAFDDDTTPTWVRDKTTFVGFLAPVIQSVPSSALGSRNVAVVIGRGGRAYETRLLAAAAAATLDHRWHVYGWTEGSATGQSNLHLHGWIDDLDGFLDRADIIIGGAGDGLIAQVAARGKRFICLPEDRAFGEQRAKARTLNRLGLAITLESWPEATAWPAILRSSNDLDPHRLHAFYDASAIAKTADAIETVAHAVEEVRR